jgi:hypothetical protein
MNDLAVTFFNNLQLDYYVYLLKLSWPALSGLFVISSILVIRLVQSIKRIAEIRDAVKILKAVLRLMLTLPILIIYFHMFLMNYSDWMNQPAVITGVVESIDKESYSANEQSALTIRSGEERIVLFVDLSTGDSLKMGNEVEAAYLPDRKELFRCTVTQQAESVI